MEDWDSFLSLPRLLVLQDLVGLIISVLLLGDFSLVLLLLLQLYSISMLVVFLVLSIPPLGIVLPFPTGINALFSHGPRRSAGLARVYALWNLTSVINVVSRTHAVRVYTIFIINSYNTWSYYIHTRKHVRAMPILRTQLMKITKNFVAAF